MGEKAAERTRTADLKITNHVLFQLSYGGSTGAAYVLKDASATPCRTCRGRFTSSGPILEGFGHLSLNRMNEWGAD